MIVREIRLENVKSYGSPAQVIRLSRGVNAICGPNGAGKSTVLEAIGCVLFQYLPYRLEDFLREGESSGSATVVVESREDGRVYEVVRRIGRGSGQLVFDPDIAKTIAQGEGDVRAWLHRHLRLDTEVDLRALFVDSVGPPQGTLTAVFLEAAQERKSKFGRLLRVQEYDQAFTKLSALEGALNEEQHAEEVAIAGLVEPAGERPALESEREGVRDRQYTLVKELQRHLAEQAALDRAIDELGRAEQVWQAACAALDLALERDRAAEAALARSQTEHRQARDATQTCARTRSGRNQHVEAVEKLRALEADQSERAALVKLRHDAELALQAATNRISRLDEEIARAERAARDVAELRQKIPEQDAAQRRLDLARDAKKETDEIRRRLPNLDAQLSRARTRVEQSEQAVTSALALHAIADGLTTRRLGYDRFANALGEANRAEGEVKALRESIAHLKQQIERRRQQQAELDRQIAS
ncbi:MAG: AAA family ATPase, partial [Chloroflexota bacterium]